MEYRVLAVGDVVGETGLSHLERTLRSVQKLKGIDFTVVNGENASGVGLTEDQAWRIYDAGADVVTLGNHTFGKMEIRHALEEQPWLLRPANFTARAPGQGWGIYDMNGVLRRWPGCSIPRWPGISSGPTEHRKSAAVLCGGTCLVQKCVE